MDFERGYNDLIKLDYQLWFVDLENYEPGDENVELVEMLLDLKENVKLSRVDKEGAFAYISIKNSLPNMHKHVEASIIFYLPHGWWNQDFWLSWMFSVEKELNSIPTAEDLSGYD